MWGYFALGVLFQIIILYVPGSLILAPTRLSAPVACACAPLISSALYSICSIAYAGAGVASPWFGIVVPCWLMASIPIALYLASAFLRRGRAVKLAKRRGEDARDRNLLFRSLATYIVLAVLVAGFLFIKGLDSAASFSQEYDNYSHLNNVRELVNRGFYFDLDRGLYPQGWHCLAALCAQFLGGRVTIAINAVNFVLLAIVFPSGVFALISRIFPDDVRTLFAGVICGIGFVAFPWGLISYGPLYPNFAAHVMLPSAAALFVAQFESKIPRAARAWRILCFGCGLASIALLHQSAVFSGIVLLVPYCCSLLGKLQFRFFESQAASRAVKTIAILFFLILVLLIWDTLFSLPNLQDMVQFGWSSFQSVGQAVASVLTISYTEGSVPQLLLGISVVAGVVYCLLNRRNLWIVASYSVCFAIYTLCTTGSGYWKFFASGFWYNDSYRIAALLALASIPLASIGLGYLFSASVRLAQTIGIDLAGSVWQKQAFIAIFACLALIGIFLPCFSENGGHGITTAFGLFEHDTIESNSLAPGSNPYDSDEIEFVDKVMDVVPDGAVIINLPYDGSMFSFGMNDLDVYFRSWWFDSPWDINADGDADSIIRSKLAAIASDIEVQKAVEQVGAEYVMLLDQGIEDELLSLDNDPETQGLQFDEEKWRPRSVYVNTYTPEWWTGISSITDATPGFEIVLAEGDMRLYKIVV